MVSSISTSAASGVSGVQTDVAIAVLKKAIQAEAQTVSTLLESIQVNVYTSQRQVTSIQQPSASRVEAVA